MQRAELSTRQVLAAFTGGIADCGGEVTDVFDDGRRLFARSVLAPVQEARPGDGMKGGVALRAADGAVDLYPYLFRMVCRNGAIAAETLGAQRLEDLGWRDPSGVDQAIRDAVRALTAREVFTTTMERVRTTTHGNVDLVLNLMPLMSRVGPQNTELLAAIMDEYFQSGDHTPFGLANAVTATARSLEHPQTRWDLEEFGGALLLGATPHTPTGGRRVRSSEGRLAGVS